MALEDRRGVTSLVPLDRSNRRRPVKPKRQHDVDAWQGQESCKDLGKLKESCADQQEFWRTAVCRYKPMSQAQLARVLAKAQVYEARIKRLQLGGISRGSPDNDITREIA